MPETAISPAFYVDDADVQVLGVADSTGQPGLVFKDFGSWRSIYSAAPLLPWQLMRNIAREAGVHIYNDQGDMIWGNNAFLAVYSQFQGRHAIHFPEPVTVEDVYEARRFGKITASIELDMGKWETRLFLIGPTRRE